MVINHSFNQEMNIKRIAPFAIDDARNGAMSYLSTKQLPVIALTLFSSSFAQDNQTEPSKLISGINKAGFEGILGTGPTIARP
jgi:hypothetical protein